jgi:cytoskeletal protein CcmA (bactofilin family)
MSKWSPANLRVVSAADISTLLSRDTEIRGSIRTQGSVRVDGTVCGDLSSAKTVTIGATGLVEGDITAEDVIVAGKVKGSLTARGKISLEGTAQIEGDLNTSRLSIAEGAVFRGLSNMGVAVRSGRAETSAEDASAVREDRIAAA